MPLPERMRFIDMTGTGGPEVLTLAEGPVPRPGEGEVLIRVAAAGVNRPDVLQRSGNYPPPPGASPCSGSRSPARSRRSAPRSRGWREGDEVCALVAGGGYAEYCVAPAPQCLPVPRGTGAGRGGRRCRKPSSRSGPTSSSAAGSRPARAFSCMAGRAASARPRSSSPARSARASSRPPASPEKCAACVELGAERAINYRQEDFVAVVKEATGGRGVDVILDMVGGDYVAKNLARSRSRGGWCRSRSCRAARSRSTSCS